MKIEPHNRKIMNIVSLILLMIPCSFVLGLVLGESNIVGAATKTFGPHARILKYVSIRKEVRKMTIVLCNKIIARELKREAVEAEQEARDVKEGKDAKDPNTRGMRKHTANPIR